MFELVLYCSIGILFCFFIEKLTKSNIFKEHTVGKEILEFNNITRTIVMLTWPLCLVVFLYNFFKTMFKIK